MFFVSESFADIDFIEIVFKNNWLEVVPLRKWKVLLKIMALIALNYKIRKYFDIVFRRNQK